MTSPGQAVAATVAAPMALDEVVEADLLELAATADARVRRLVLRGQEAGELRVDVPAAWVLSSNTWLVVAAADGVRLGRLAARDVERRLRTTVLDGLRRPPEGVS